MLFITEKSTYVRGICASHAAPTVWSEVLVRFGGWKIDQGPMFSLFFSGYLCVHVFEMPFPGLGAVLEWQKGGGGSEAKVWRNKGIA